MKRSIPRRGPAVMAAGVAVALLAAGCASSTAAVDQTSVDSGADKEEFAEALADMDPVDLKVQVLTPKESAHAKAIEAYAESVKEWSGDKITFTMHYSGSIASTDVESAVADGLIDVAPLYPGMDPDNFPVHAFASNFAFMNDNSPVVGTLQGAAAWTEAGFDDSVMTEMQDGGLQPLLPMVVPSSNSLYCAEDEVSSLDDAKGTSIRAGTPGNDAEIKAIGASSVNLPTLEVFEGMQRGTVDCVATGWAVPLTFSLAEVSQHWMVDPSIHFTGSSETLAIGKETWDGLPLAARQLLWDQLDVYLKSYFENNMFATMQGALGQAEEQGVSLEEYDDDLVESLEDHHTKQRDAAGKNSPEGFDGDSFVEATEESHDTWKQAMIDLGYDEDVTWDEYLDWSKENPVDVEPAVDKIVEDVLDEHRPTAE